MLGWCILLFRLQDGGAEPAQFDSLQAERIAIWQTGLSGLDWLDELVKAGTAIDLGGNGYPCRYTAVAGTLLPRILAGPPLAREVWAYGEFDILTSAWAGKTVIDRAAAERCRPEEWLLVEAWDES